MRVKRLQVWTLRLYEQQNLEALVGLQDNNICTNHLRKKIIKIKKNTLNYFEFSLTIHCKQSLTSFAKMIVISIYLD